ncbi:MAG: spore germination protein GerW family protein [Acidimicrobiia bacterium]|nr:spore germination protein GerW family protein [Acidimicrobiia bacterium]
MTQVDNILSEARDTLTVKRVFGEPLAHNGITVIPAAAIRGGGGGGEGEAGADTPGGAGGGFGMSARPVGAYQIKDDEVTWVPAADTTKVIVLGEVVAIVALLVLRSVLKRRRRA